MAPRYKPEQTYQTQIPTLEAFNFDVDAFDDAIRSQGVMLEHYRAMRCPVGIIDRDDTVRRPHEHHEGCSNGFIYTKVGCFQALFTGNGSSSDSRDQGLAESSSAQITAPRFYAAPEGTPQHECKDRVLLAPYDRLYYPDASFVVGNWELVEAHPSGRDRLSFPAERITAVIDNTGKRYSDADWTVENGWLVWKGSNQPGLDSGTGKGRIYTVHFVYRPFWYVQKLNHEIRVAAIDDPELGRISERMPQGATIQREYVYLNKEQDPVNAGDARMHREPADGSFPAR